MFSFFFLEKFGFDCLDLNLKKKLVRMMRCEFDANATQNHVSGHHEIK